MNIANIAGGSSRKEQENGDGSNESERPLKKARFAWQVKGKYHLKNDNNDAAKTATVTLPDPDEAGSSSVPSSNNSSSGNEQNLEALGDYLMNQDLKALDSVISPPDSSLFLPSTSVSNERLPYPRYVSSCERTRGSRIIDMNTYADSFAPSSAEDQCINRWQTKQMVKSFVDNSINKVLDRWVQVPSDDHATRNVALDVADFINNLPGDNSIENEGILMAISAHGLQQTTSTVITKNFIEHDWTHNSKNNTDNLCSLTSSYCEATVPSDGESDEPIIANDQTDSDTFSEKCNSPWSILEDDKDDSSDITHYPLFPDVTDLSYGGVNDSHENPSSEFQGVDNQNNNDFLDHAIMFAIQSKGLTTFGSDYG